MWALQKFLLFHALTCLGQNALGAKIINGVKVREDSMQFMASLQIRSRHRCGGSLISSNFVLTAAHCDHDGLAKVVLGTHNLKKTGTVRTIVQKCKHPNYWKFDNGSDIMLLKLSQNVPVGGTIRRIRLPPPDMNLQPNQMCRVAGWGWTQDTHYSVTDLRVVNVSVVDQNDCRRTRPNLPDNVICTGFEKLKGSCKGDSGGPVVCNGVAAGLVSFGKRGCNDPNFPKVNTDVSKFRPWIDQILQDNGC